MEKRKKALLVALVIGDGYIRIDDRQKNPKGTLKLCHSIDQLGYLEYKTKLLNSLLGGNLPKIREYTCTLSNGNTYKQVRSEKTHRYFRILRKWLYPNKYNPKYLKYLTPEAIAIWYMDDGSVIANNRYPDGTCSSARTNLHLCTDIKSAEEVCKYFYETWNIKFTTFKEKNNHSIRCFHSEGEKFHRMIKDFIIPSMKYKQRFYLTRAHSPSDEGDDIV